MAGLLAQDNEGPSQQGCKIFTRPCPIVRVGPLSSRRLQVVDIQDMLAIALCKYNSNNLLNVHIALLSTAEITLEESFRITWQRIEALPEPNLIAAAFSDILATPALDVPLGLDVFVVAENTSRRFVIG